MKKSDQVEFRVPADVANNAMKYVVALAVLAIVAGLVAAAVWLCVTGRMSADTFKGVVTVLGAIGALAALLGKVFDWLKKQ